MDDSRLANLMTYTVFHLGVYLSLFTALIGAGILASLDHWLLRLAVACFAGAGVAGAVIGSNIPKFVTAENFFKAKIGPWGLRMMTYDAWATIEHGIFWIGFASLAVPFLLCGPSAFRL